MAKSVGVMVARSQYFFSQFIRMNTHVAVSVNKLGTVYNQWGEREKYISEDGGGGDDEGYSGGWLWWQYWWLWY